MVMTRPAISREQLLQGIRKEYFEMPGLALTRRQTQRLLAIDEQTCVELLNALTEARFLRRRPDGVYVRVFDAAFSFPAPRMAGVQRPSASRERAS
jgi:hypothetical protein